MKFRFALLAAAAALAVGSAQASTYTLSAAGDSFDSVSGWYVSDSHWVVPGQNDVWQFSIFALGALESVDLIGPSGTVTPDVVNPDPISGSNSFAAVLTFYSLSPGSYYLMAKGPAGADVLDVEAVYPSPIPEPQTWSLALAGVLMSAGLWARRAQA